LTRGRAEVVQQQSDEGSKFNRKGKTMIFSMYAIEENGKPAIGDCWGEVTRGCDGSVICIRRRSPPREKRRGNRHAGGHR